VRFLLDTNICSVYLRQHPLVFQKMLQHSGQLAMSSITWAELYSWATQPTAPPSRLTALLDLVSDVDLLPVDREVAEMFGQLRVSLRQVGGTVPELDAIIAATALTHGLVLVTNNTKDFLRITGLALQDWTQP
jgi:tRNA(fMet)-specific endonuclease VapC